VTDERQHPAILASDAEREAAVDRLRRAVVDGRLTLEEFSDRVGLAQVARTDQDLAVLGSDLPAAPTAVPLTDVARHRAFCSRIVRSGPWELPVRVSLEGGGPFASQVIHSPQLPPVEGAPVLRIKASGPGGTLYVRNQRERPRWFKLLGKGDPYA